jgi:hypothetical protein
MTKQTKPDDLTPYERTAVNLVKGFRARLDHESASLTDERFAMLQTVLIVRAIDRLTDAVKANTKAMSVHSSVPYINDNGAEIPIVRSRK